MLSIQQLLNINENDIKNYNIKLDNIDQFNIDTRTLYSLNIKELVKAISYKCDSTIKKQNFNYNRDRKYTIHFIRYEIGTNLWLFIGVYTANRTYDEEKY